MVLRTLLLYRKNLLTTILYHQQQRTASNNIARGRSNLIIIDNSKHRRNASSSYNIYQKYSNLFEKLLLNKKNIAKTFSTIVLSSTFIATACITIKTISTPIVIMADDTTTTTINTNNKDVIQHSDQLFDENQYEEAYEMLKKCADKSTADVKWRQCRALYKMSKEDSNKGRRKELIIEAYELIDEALKLNDQDYAVHKWMSVLLDAKSELDGIKARISQLENVKKHMVRAIELNPEDPTTWHILGNFSYSLADMPWYTRKIVTALFATPPTGTYEEALENFLRAEEKKPNFYSMNLLFIGKCYQNLKNTEKAKEYLGRASNVTVLNDEDKRCKEEATELLRKL